jgi:hypothetical protein
VAPFLGTAQQRNGCRDLLPRLGSLEAPARDAAMRCMLEDLDRLKSLDPFFAADLKLAAFVPNQRGQLCAPSALYDPRSVQQGHHLAVALASLSEGCTHLPSLSRGVSSLVIMRLQGGLKAAPADANVCFTYVLLV